jgi:hypothetical protein
LVAGFVGWAGSDVAATLADAGLCSVVAASRGGGVDSRTDAGDAGAGVAAVGEAGASC